MTLIFDLAWTQVLYHLESFRPQADLHFLRICGMQDHDGGGRITVERQVGIVHIDIAV